MHFASAAPGRFCWVDLAATDADHARRFYRDVFGWSAETQGVEGGHFTRLLMDGEAVGSLYQLRQEHLRRGMPSHWTPYIRVADISLAVHRATLAGGRVIVPPFTLAGIARIALIVDLVGAPVGLWQGAATGAEAGANDR